MKKKHFLTSLSGWLLLLGLALPLSVQATDVVVADANGNELTYSYDTDDGPATFKAVKTYAADEAKKGRIIIADYVTDANNNSHEVKYISGRVGNFGNIVSIVFGQNIVAVGGADGSEDDAFYNCSKLESVTLNAKLEILGRFAFQSCPKLESINLEDCTNLTTLKYRCFQGSGLKSVTIPASVTTFDGDLFGYCPLETVTFLAENVPNSMFSGYSKITTLNLGPDVKTIGNEAFRHNYELTTINFDPAITGLTIGNYAFQNADKVRTLDLPAGLKSIGYDTFYSLDSLRTVTFADGCQLETLGQYAFEANPVLESINLEACKQLTTISANAFYNLPALKAITIPASVTTFGSRIFDYTNNIKTFTVLCAEVPADLYRDRPSLRTVNIGPGVKKLGSACFYNSDGLKEVNIDANVSDLVIDQYVFSECDSLPAIHLPAGVVSLGYRVFRLCRQLASITFAEGSALTQIPAEAFAHCEAMETITLPDAVQTIIGNDNFYGCINLREVNFGTGLTTLPNDNGNFFAYCSKLEKLVFPGQNFPATSNLGIPADVVLYVHPDLVDTYRANDSYYKNYRIMAIGSTTDYAVTTTAGGQLQSRVAEDVAQYALSLTVTGPLNGTDINYLHSAFPCLQVLNLKNARIVAGGDKYNQWNVAQNGTATVNTYYGPWDTEDDVVGYAMFYNMPSLRSLSLPNGTKKIGGYAVAQDLRRNLQLAQVDVPASVTEIGRYAFYYAGVTEVTVPAGVTRLEEYTFHHCDKLQKATLSNAITYIGYACFSDDYVLEDVNIPASVETIDTYAFNENHKLSTPVVIPNTCKTIGYHAFYNNYELPSVTFGNSLETIGEGAFAYCYKIESAVLPETVTSLGAYAFHNCDSLRTFNFPQNITQVPHHVLWDCNALTSVTLAEGTTSIAEAAFADCPKLSSVNIKPEMPLTYIGNWGFDDTALTSMTLPNTITDMGYSVFCNCHQLKSVNVPTGMDRVPYNYCYNCENLTDVQMHDGIRNIQHEAFYGCSSLETIDLNDQITGIEYRAFQGCSKLNLPKLPDALTKLESAAFHQTPSFTTALTIPAGVTYIGDDCFHASAIRGVVMHDGITLGGGVFRNNDSLRSVRLPQDLKILPHYTFYHCDSLQYVDLPDGLEEIRYNCFDLSGLTAIDLPESLHHIGNYAFASTQITSFRMPDGFTGTDFGSYFLAYNYHLKSAHLGRNMDYTGYTDMSTFYHCDSLELLRLYTPTPPPASWYNFEFRGNCVLEVPEGSEDNYRNTDVWKDFKEIRGFFTGDELAEADFAVLKDIYEKLDSTKWTTAWDLTDNHNPNGKWIGVSTAKRGSETSLIYGITDIDLSAMGLTGQLPESVFRLKDLKTLNLSYNHISGNAAEIISNIPDSKRAPLTDLNLRGNELSGDAYVIASALPQLTKLNLSYNQISDVSQVIPKTTLTDLNLEMQFIDWFTKQPVAAAEDVAQDITAGVPANIEWPATFSYRHGSQDFGRNPGNLYRPYCTNINGNYWSNTYELVKTDGLWNIDTYDTRMLRAPKNQPVAYAMDWQTVILRFNWEDGDVNADQTVDVTDLQSVVNFAFNDRKYTGEMFNYGDADCNGDNTINIIDIVGNVERVLAYTAPAPSRMRIYNKVSADANNVLSMEGTGLTLHNTDQVAALQLTVAGATQHDVSMNSDLKNRFSVAMRQADDGLRIVVYSSEGRMLQPGSHELLSGLPAGAVVTDVVLSDASAQRLGVTVEGNVTTGVQYVATESQQTVQEVYDLQGRRLDTDWQSLPTGVYVIRVNGKQYKVKK